MSKTITITVPDAVHRAVQAKGAMFEMGAGDYLKQFVLASAMGAEIPLGLKAIMERQQAEADDAVEQDKLKLDEE